MAMKRMGLSTRQWVPRDGVPCLEGGGWAQEDPSAMRLRDQFSDQVQAAALRTGLPSIRF